MKGSAGFARAVESRGSFGAQHRAASRRRRASTLRDRSGFLRFLVALELRQVRQQFVLLRQAEEVVADHLVGALRGLAAGPQADEHAGDDRTVRLDLDARRVVAVQVSAAQHVLQNRKKISIVQRYRSGEGVALRSPGRHCCPASEPSTSVTACRTSLSLGSRATGWRILAHLHHDLSELLRVEDLGGLAERPEGEPLDAQLPLHLAQPAGLLQRPHRPRDGVEHRQEQQEAILVEVQSSVARLVPLAPHVVQALQQRHELVEVFQARDLFFGDCFAFPAGHAMIMRVNPPSRNTPCAGSVEMRKYRAEQDWVRTVFRADWRSRLPLGSEKQF